MKLTLEEALLMKIFTDSACDLAYAYLQENDVEVFQRPLCWIRANTKT